MEAVQLDSSGWLNGWECGTEERQIQTLTVTCSKLLASHTQSAVTAIPQEYTARIMDSYKAILLCPCLLPQFFFSDLNLLHNAFSFSPAYGSFHLCYHKSHLLCSVWCGYIDAYIWIICYISVGKAPMWSAWHDFCHIKWGGNEDGDWESPGFGGT